MAALGTGRRQNRMAALCTIPRTVDGPKSDSFIYSSDDEGAASSQTQTCSLRWQPKLPLVPPLALRSFVSLSYDGWYRTGSDQDLEEISEFSSEDKGDSEIKTAVRSSGVDA